MFCEGPIRVALKHDVDLVGLGIIRFRDERG